MLCQLVKQSSAATLRVVPKSPPRSEGPIGRVSVRQSQCTSRQRKSCLSYAVPRGVHGSLRFKQVSNSSQSVNRCTALLALFTSPKHQALRCRRVVCNGSGDETAAPSEDGGEAAADKAQVQLQTKTRVEFTCNKCGGRTVSSPHTCTQEQLSEQHGTAIPKP